MNDRQFPLVVRRSFRSPATLLARAALLAALSGCAGGSFLNGPDSKYFDDLTENAVRSVTGAWHATSVPVTMEFALSEAAGGQVTGSGTMVDVAAANSVPITITGSYVKPTLSLKFEGIVYKGNPVSGTFEGKYESFQGIGSTLRVTSAGGVVVIDLLLQEYSAGR